MIIPSEIFEMILRFKQILSRTAGVTSSLGLLDSCWSSTNRIAKDNAGIVYTIAVSIMSECNRSLIDLHVWQACRRNERPVELALLTSPNVTLPTGSANTSRTHFISGSSRTG